MQVLQAGSALACTLRVGHAQGQAAGHERMKWSWLARVFVTGRRLAQFHRWCPTESIVTHSWYRVASLAQPQGRTHTVREYDV